MRLMRLSWLLYWLEGINRYGWLFLVAHVYPCTFQQDIHFKNKGVDILKLGRGRGGYWSGLIRNNPHYQ